MTMRKQALLGNYQVLKLRPFSIARFLFSVVLSPQRRAQRLL